MSKKMTPIAAALGAAFAMSLAAAPVSAATANPFSVTDLSSGYQQVADAHKDGKCGEGKCGAKDKAKKHGTEAKCGEGKCGGDKAKAKAKEAKCGEGKCGGDKAKAKAKEAKCGEGKCGGKK